MSPALQALLGIAAAVLGMLILMGLLGLAGWAVVHWHSWGAL